MSNKSTYSFNSLKNNENMRDSIPCRIEFIKDLLKDNKLEALVDFENTDTEYYKPQQEEDASGKSYDTRIVLKKRTLDFSNTISQIGGQLRYIKSGTTGHTFKGEMVDKFGSFEYAVKVVPYPIKQRYGSINDTRRPENVEVVMIKLLSYFVAKRQTPHIVLPIGTFNTTIDTFVNLIDSKVVSKKNSKYKEFLKDYKEGKFHDTVSVLISEWANRGDLLDFIRKYYNEMSAIQWKVIFFQVLSVLAVIQSKYPSFRHNDLKANNILVHKTAKKNDAFTYTITNCNYRVPNIGYQIKLWDFDFACIPEIIDNKKVQSTWAKKYINVMPVQNRYYDVHYFFNTLTVRNGFCPQIMTSDHVPQEVKDFISRIIPKKYQKMDTKYVSERGRIMINDEYVTPNDLLKYDPYFEEFRIKSAVKMINNTAENDLYLSEKNKYMPKQSSVPDITKFLKPDSKSDDEIKVKKILRGGAKKKQSSLKKSKKLKKVKKKKIKSRTISEEIRELDPDVILRD